MKKTNAFLLILGIAFFIGAFMTYMLQIKIVQQNEQKLIEQFSLLEEQQNEFDFQLTPYLEYDIISEQDVENNQEYHLQYELDVLAKDIDGATSNLLLYQESIQRLTIDRIQEQKELEIQAWDQKINENNFEWNAEELQKYENLSQEIQIYRNTNKLLTIDDIIEMRAVVTKLSELYVETQQRVDQDNDYIAQLSAENEQLRANLYWQNN